MRLLTTNVGELFSNDWREVGFGSSQMDLRDASGGCKWSKGGGSSDCGGGGGEVIEVELWESWTRGDLNRRVGGG